MRWGEFRGIVDEIHVPMMASLGSYDYLAVRVVMLLQIEHDPTICELVLIYN